MTTPEDPSDTAAYTEAYIMQNMFTPQSGEKEDYEALSNKVTGLKEILGSMDDEQLVDKLTRYKKNLSMSDENLLDLCDAAGERTLDMAEYLEFGDEASAKLTTALQQVITSGDTTEINSLIMVIGIEDKAAADIMLKNLKEEVVPFIRSETETEALESKTKGLALRMLLQKPITGALEEKLDRLSSATEILEGTIVALPYLDKERALRVYELALDGDYQSVSAIVAISLQYLPEITEAPEEAIVIRIWEKALKYKYWYVAGAAIEAAVAILELHKESPSGLMSESLAEQLKTLMMNQQEPEED